MLMQCHLLVLLTRDRHRENIQHTRGLKCLQKNTLIDYRDDNTD